jgi:hypothetical protein
MLGVNCPDDVKSVAVAIVNALEAAVQAYAAQAGVPVTPVLPDHGFPPSTAPNVFGRLDAKDFAAFFTKLQDAAATAREALDCTSMHKGSLLWRKLFGDDFPKADPDGGDGGDGPSGGYTPPDKSRGVQQTRFASP